MEIKFTQMQENFRSFTYNELYKTKTFEQIRNFRMDYLSLPIYVAVSFKYL